MADTSTAALEHKHKVTPYQDMQLPGKVEATFVRGQLVFQESGLDGIGLKPGRHLAPRPCGNVLLYGQL